MDTSFISIILLFHSNKGRLDHSMYRKLTQNNLSSRISKRSINHLSMYMDKTGLLNWFPRTILRLVHSKGLEIEERSININSVKLYLLPTAFSLNAPVQRFTHPRPL